MAQIRQKKRPGLVPGKVQSGISPHSQAQDLSNTTSISTPAATLPWLEIAGLGTGEENYWGKEAPKPQILPQGMSYAGPMGAYPMLYTPHKRGFWAKISDWWDGEPYQGNPTLPRSTPKQHRPIPGIANGVTPTAAAPYAPLAKTLQNPAITPAFNSLPRWERKLIEKQQKAEIKAWKKMEKEQTKLYKRSLKFTIREERRNLKAMEKELKKNNQFNHAHIPLHNGQRPLPQVSDHAPEEPKPKLEPEKPKKEMLAFMMLPQEEFGVRRPLGGDGMPKGLGGRHHWPMMSRTMTHALINLGNDEKSYTVRPMRMPL